MQRSIKISNDFRSICMIRRLIKKYNPDIVYAHSSKAGALARISNVGLRSKSIYNPHGWAFNMRCSKKEQIIYIMVEKILSSFCYHIICISEAEKVSALNKKICSKNKLKVIVNGVDIEQYEKDRTKNANLITRDKLGIPQNAFVVGAVGRLSFQKSPDVFIKAAKKIKERIPESYFIMVGDGEQKNDLLKYAKEYELLDSLLITGWVHNPLKYIALFDVALLLSRWEGFGLALPEYMISNKPIVATNVDAIPNIIVNYKNGILIGPDDPEAVFKAVVKLHQNLPLRERLIQAGHEIAYEKFDCRRMAKEHERVFLDLLESKSLKINGLFL